MTGNLIVILGVLFVVWHTPLSLYSWLYQKTRSGVTYLGKSVAYVGKRVPRPSAPSGLIQSIISHILFAALVLAGYVEWRVPHLPAPVVTPDTPDIDTPDTPDTPGTPVSFSGFRVLIRYETAPDNSQQWLINMMADPGVREYLDSHCEGRADGWRYWDDDLSPVQSFPWLQELDRIEHIASPNVVIAANGKARAFAVPKTEAEFLALLKQFGGN